MTGLLAIAIDLIVYERWRYLCIDVVVNTYERMNNEDNTHENIYWHMTDESCQNEMLDWLTLI
jgi:hypothetical protein